MTADARMESLKKQRYLISSLDNYNQFQPFSTQRCGKCGMFHNGIVFNSALPNEFNKPEGILLLHRVDRSTWSVRSLSLSIDFCHC
jgi:hypothetical protein